MTQKTSAASTVRAQGGGRTPVTMENFVPDLVEHGAPIRGEPQTLEARLFVQLQVFTGCLDTSPVVEGVRDSGLEATVYANVNDPRGVGVLLMSEDPRLFLEAGRALFTGPVFAPLSPLPDFTMLGRTYSTGREPDLRDFLLPQVDPSLLLQAYVHQLQQLLNNFYYFLR